MQSLKMSPALTNGNPHSATFAPSQRRGPIAAEFQGPGPAAVALPSTIGKNTSESTKGRAPSFSFGVRYEQTKSSPGPGPGQYNVARLHYKGKDDGPAPSLSGRPRESKQDFTPAPGAYSPEKGIKFVNESSPSYTFGAKVQNEKPDNKPAPNAYSLPPALGTGLAPAFSMSGRGRVPIDERVLNPGPGQYESGCQDQYKARSPSYSISGRTHIPTDQTQKPGPGAHSPEKINLEASPAHTFGVKHSPYLGKLKGY